MLRKMTLAAAAAATALTAVPATADARPRGKAHGYYKRSAHARAYADHDRYYDRGYQDRSYAYRDGYRRCRSGTTGAIVGGVAGALLGREIAGRGDRTLGTILAGAVGAYGGAALTRDRNCR